MTEPNNTPEAENPVHESTPLLANHAAETAATPSGENVENGDAAASTLAEPQQLRTPAVVRISTFVSLTASLLAFALLLAAYVVSLSVNRQSYVFSSLNEAIWGLEWTILFVILFDSINIHKLRTTANARTFFPLLIQIPVDLLITIFVLNFAGQAVDAGFSRLSCPDYGNELACGRWFLALKILLGCGIGAATTVSLAHLSLVIIRTVAFFQGRLWTGSPWMIPAGQLTLEFSIKFLRQER